MICWQFWTFEVFWSKILYQPIINQGKNCNLSLEMSPKRITKTLEVSLKTVSSRKFLKGTFCQKYLIYALICINWWQKFEFWEREMYKICYFLMFFKNFILKLAYNPIMRGVRAKISRTFELDDIFFRKCRF